MATRSALVHTSTFDLSYKTMIRQVLPGGLTIGNVTRYGVTTTLHQYKCGVRSCNVVMDDVPVGCSDLWTLAVNRHLIGMVGGSDWVKLTDDNKSVEYMPVETLSRV